MSDKRKDWGFPKWGDYGTERDAVRVRLCDYHGCEKPGDHRAPKSPYTDDKWWFCEDHAAEYNKNWNFFAGMRDEEARAYAKRERRTAEGYAKTDPFSAWGGTKDEGGLTRVERDAFNILQLEGTASLDEIKKQFRHFAKKYHPDVNKGDPEAEKKFQQVTFAYEVLMGKFQKPPKA